MDRCKLIGELQIGSRLANGSYTNNLGILQRKEAVFLLKAEQPFVNEYWLKISSHVIQSPISTEE